MTSTDRRDQRSPEASAYRALYKTTLWQRIRATKLAEHPLCERCDEKGLVVPAKIVHHLEPHKGDVIKFFSGPFQSLCPTCHDSHAQSEERRGFSTEIGTDGWPVDAKHPSNRPRKK